jgi:hypothetical protein
MPKKPQAKDPFLASLDEESDRSGKADTWRTEAIASLYVYHHAESKTSFSAISAMVLAGKIGIPAPMWAVELVEKAITDFMRGGGPLDIAFGFKGEGTGNTKGAEARQRLRKLMLEMLCARVHQLVADGLSKTKACRQVARQVKGLSKLNGKVDTFPWYDGQYKIELPNADTLLKRWYPIWEKNMGEIQEIGGDTARGKHIESLTHAINRFNDVLRCHVANPSQQLDKATISAWKEFLESLQSNPTTSHT